MNIEDFTAVDDRQPYQGIGMDFDVATNLGLENVIIEDLAPDTILVEYIDSSNGLIERNGLLVSPHRKNTWRYARVVLVDSLSSNKGIKYGDIVVFEDSHGLAVGETRVRIPSNEIVEVKEGKFVNHSRIFCKVSLP